MQALCVGSVFQSHCAAPGAHGEVHSVFERVVNLRVHGGLLSLTARDIGGSSRYLITCMESFAHFPLEAGQPCTLAPDRVKAGPASILLCGAPLWRGPLDKNARGAAGQKTEARFKAILNRLRPGAGRYAWLKPAALAALGDEHRAAEAVRGLVGLGPGLTPAGDDMLLGYIAVYNHLGENRKLQAALHAAVIRNLPRTADLSAQMLGDAVNGDYHEYVQAVVEALRTDMAEELDTLLPRLLSIGASSGTDIACGMAAALQNVRERRETVLSAGAGPSGCRIQLPALEPVDRSQ